MTVSVALAKAHMSVSGDQDDELIALYVEAAGEFLSNYIGRSLSAFDPLPADLKLAVLRQAAFFYEHREAANTFGSTMQIAPYGVTAIADAYRTRWFGEAHG